MRTLEHWRLRNPCESREQRSARAKHRLRKKLPVIPFLGAARAARIIRRYFLRAAARFGPESERATLNCPGPSFYRTLTLGVRDSTNAAAKLVPRVPVREHAPRDFLRQIRREEPREIARRRPRSPHFTARDLRPEPEHLLGRPVCESVSRAPTKNIAFCPVGDKSVHSFHEPPARRTSATRALTVATFAAMWNRLSSLRGRPCIRALSATHCN